MDPTPLYPFGHGLTYGRIAYGPTRVSGAELAWSETLTVSCEISETAGVALVIAGVALHRAPAVEALSAS